MKNIQNAPTKFLLLSLVAFCIPATHSIYGYGISNPVNQPGNSHTVIANTNNTGNAATAIQTAVNTYGGNKNIFNMILDNHLEKLPLNINYSHPALQIYINNLLVKMDGDDSS